MKKLNISINDAKINASNYPFIVAEMSGNHNKSLSRALEIVDAAAEAGVDAIKMQTYTANLMTLNLNKNEFKINDKDSLWNGLSLFELYEKASTPWEWHKDIMERCRNVGLICFSTPFDFSAVDFLETLEVPAYKIASFEIVDLPLIRKIARTGKPMFISTGMATISEIDEAVTMARKNGCDDLILLKCTSDYPSEPKDANILTLPHMEKLFQCPVGISDHTLGIGVSLAAITLGANVIEKHFTLRRNEGGVDAAFSLEKDEMKMLVQESKRVKDSLGTIFYGSTEGESKSIRFRRSIYASGDIKKDETFTFDNIRIIRPGYGIYPKYFDIILGKRAALDISKGTAIEWRMIG
jgi:N-acetylneuraminate synthase|tara:strand:- start:1466 stop:2524 length:1059 start_codon:yes stop_codon:yes gene_type:complete